MHQNVEVKARCLQPERIREILAAAKATFRGTDRQVDTYFKVSSGRLKLREGNIEHALIYYEREDRAGPKEAAVSLLPQPPPQLKELLTKALGIFAIVEKQREIYFAGNVKVHLDNVKGLGSFVEIEAIDRDGSIGKEQLQRQCEEWMARFQIPEQDLITVSYSDLLAEQP